MNAKRQSYSLHEIELRGHHIPFRVQRSRTRAIRITVRGEAGIVVTASLRVSLNEIKRVLSQHQRWLLDRFRELEKARQLLYDSTGRPRTLFRGRWLRLELHENAELVFRSENGILQVPMRKPSESIQHWYRNQARAEFRKLSSRLSDAMGISYSRLHIRSQKSRWGSFSSKGTLSLNWRLLMAPPEVYRYVIVHELAHAHHMNHSTSFWRTVAIFCPNYREQVRWLKEHRLLLELLSSFSHLRGN